MLKIVIAIVLLAHGIGHILGPMQVFKVAVANPAWNGDSWLLTGLTGQQLGQGIGVVLWAASVVGFVMLAGVVMGWMPAAWWAPLAVASSLVSLAAIALFPMAFPTFSTIGAVLVDAAVLVSVLVLRWTPNELPA